MWSLKSGRSVQKGKSLKIVESVKEGKECEKSNQV